VKREFHALFCENTGVKLLCVTRLAVSLTDRPLNINYLILKVNFKKYRQ